MVSLAGLIRALYLNRNEQRRNQQGEEGDQIHPRAWNHEFIQLPLVIKENQNRPTITQDEITELLSSLRERGAVLVALVAGSGLRIGEALAVRTDDFHTDYRVLHMQRSIWHRREQAPKTPNAIRLVDIPDTLAHVLRRYTQGKQGYLFTTRAGWPLDVGDHVKTSFFELSPAICRFQSTDFPGKRRNEPALSGGTEPRRRDRVATMIRHASPEK